MSPSQTQLQNDSLQFSCGHCQAQLAVPVELAGVTAPCPHCHGEIMAPRVMERPPLVDPIPKEKKARQHSTGIALFEKKGFRTVRLVLSVAACVVIFMAFHSLKTRRWERPNQPGQTVQTPAATAPEIAPETLPETPAIQGVTPPALPNLRTLSAGQ